MIIRESQDHPIRYDDYNQEPWREMNRMIKEQLKGRYKVLFYNIEDCNKMPESLKFVAFDWENLEVIVYREPNIKVYTMKSYNEVLHNLKLNESRFISEGMKIEGEEDYKRVFLFKDLDKGIITELKKGDRTIKKGDYLSTCWGYDQTNVEIFVIKKILGKNYIIIQEVGQCIGSESGTVTYDNMKIDERVIKIDLPIKAYISNDGYMSICESGYKRSLGLTDLKKEHYVTNTQFGH